jgi:large subunit ribosomal protein L10
MVAGALKALPTRAAGLFQAPLSQMARLAQALEDKKSAEAPAGDAAEAPAATVALTPADAPAATDTSAEPAE